jgi:hypothetical protein
MHYGGSLPFHGTPARKLYLAEVVQRISHEVDNPAQQFLTHRSIKYPPGSPHIATYLQGPALAQHNDAHFIRIKVKGYSEQVSRKTDQFIRLYSRQARNPGNAAVQ